MPSGPAATTTARARWTLRSFCQPGARAHGFDLVALAPVGGAERADVDDRAFRQHGRAAALGEVEVVLHQRVLRPVRAADHAAPAQPAARALGSLAAEVRVRDGLAGLAEEDAHRRLFVRLAHAELLAELAQELIGGVVVRVLHDAEHPLRLGVVGREHALPVVHLRPLAVLEERLRRHVQRVRIAQAAAAHAAAGDDCDVLEGGHPEDAPHPQVGAPEVALQVGGGPWKLVVGEPTSALQHAHRVALLRQPQRRDAAAEARADDEPVEVEMPCALHSHCHLSLTDPEPVATTPLYSVK